MKKIFTLFVLLICFGFEANSQSITRLVGHSPFQDSLWVFDTTNFNVIRRMAPFPSAGGSITGTVGSAENPISGNIYMVIKQSAVIGRVLGVFNPLTGLVTIVGNLGDNFSSITFTSDGKLYGVTGNGATVPETLYQIDTATAAKRLVKTLGNGVDGEIICYNPDDNMIYHWSGNGTIVYEKFDTITGPYNFINIPIVGTTNGETFGMVYRSNNVFIGSNIGSRFQLWNSSGGVFPQYGNSSPDDIRGTVLMTCSRVISGNPAFCTGDSTLLTSDATTAANYEWFLNGVQVANGPSASYYASQVGHYNVIVSDACGTDSLGTGVDVVQNSLPVVNVNSTQTNLCPGGSITLTGTGGGTSQWYLDGVAIVGANSSTYSATAAGVYNMTKTNLNGCSDSAAVGITIVAVPNPVVNIGNDTTICDGNTVILDAMNAGAIYQWSPSGNSAQTESITTAGAHIVIVTDANGCSSSDTMNLTVNPLPLVNVGNDTATCGTAVMLDAGNPGSTYQWCDGSTGQTTTLPVSGTCIVIVTDANGCTSSDTINITINTPPTVSATTATDTLCINFPPTPLSGSPLGGTFAGPGVSGITFTPSIAGAGTHAVYYDYTDANGCSGSDTVMIFVGGLPTVVASASNNTVCFDDANVTLTGSPSGGTFSGPGVTGNSFDPSIAGNGTHTVTYSYTDAIGCSNTGTTVITVNACVGITEHAAVNGTSLFPNPSSGNVNINLNATSSVTIFNTLGENVMSIQLTTGIHTIDMSNLAEGIYFVRTQNVNGISTQRLIISR